MRRDIDALTGRIFDVLIVGGGIYGLAVAYDAAQRGLSVALLERDDFGSGASFNHLRTIHGGLRYLQGLDIRRARESVVERRTIARIAPHAVAPLAFVLPLRRSVMRGTTAMRAGLALDRMVAFDRNRGVAASHHLPAGRVVPRDAALRAYPELDPRLTGAAVSYDYVTVEPDRLTFSFAVAAVEHGAAIANHVAATALVAEGRRVVGVRAKDSIGQREMEVRARVTVNATGGAMDRLIEPLGLSTRMATLKAMNLVTSRPGGAAAVAGATRSGRHLFNVPWRGRALFGTWESQPSAADGCAGVCQRDIDEFIDAINQAFPSVRLSADEVTLVHHGVVPAVVDAAGRVVLEGHERIHDHARHGLEGIVSLAGAKYTTARGVAERVTDLIMRKLNRPPVGCRTAIAPLPGGELNDGKGAGIEAAELCGVEFSSETRSHLIAAYGSRVRDVLSPISERPEWSARVAPDLPVIEAQLAWAASHEMAVTLSDAMIRRTPLGALGYPGDLATARAADVVGRLLGWTAERRGAEIEMVRAFYAATSSSRDRNAGADPAASSDR